MNVEGGAVISHPIYEYDLTLITVEGMLQIVNWSHAVRLPSWFTER